MFQEKGTNAKNYLQDPLYHSHGKVTDISGNPNVNLVEEQLIVCEIDYFLSFEENICSRNQTSVIPLTRLFQTNMQFLFRIIFIFEMNIFKTNLVWISCEVQAAQAALVPRLDFSAVSITFHGSCLKVQSSRSTKYKRKNN